MHRSHKPYAERLSASGTPLRPSSDPPNPFHTCTWADYYSSVADTQ
jgi:hypothetical protein